MRKGVMKAYAAERWLYLHHFRMIPKIIKIHWCAGYGEKKEN